MEHEEQERELNIKEKNKYHEHGEQFGAKAILKKNMRIQTSKKEQKST